MTAVGLVEILILVVAILVIAVGVVVALLRPGRRSAGDLDAGRGGTDVLARPRGPTAGHGRGAGSRRRRSRRPRRAGRPTLERPEAVAGRLVRLRDGSPAPRAPSAGACWPCSPATLDEATWEEIEDLLLTADIGVAPTQELVERLRTRLRGRGAHAAPCARCCARSCSPSSTRAIDRRLAYRARRAARRSCWSSASTAPARPRPSASSPASSSPRTARSSWARPTPSAPPPPTS